MIGGGCVCTGLLTDPALSLVFVSEGLWETGSQTSAVDRKQTSDHTLDPQGWTHKDTAISFLDFFTS